MKKANPSFNDMKKSEQFEALEKAGTMTKLALAAALAAPVLSTHKGTLFDSEPKHAVHRHIAGEPAHEKDDTHEEVHTDMGDGVTYISKQKKLKTIVSEKAQSVKDKLTSIRNQIKGME